MPKQIKIIENNKAQIAIWHSEGRPTDWIARQLNVGRGLLKSCYPTYKGSRGNTFNNKIKIAKYEEAPNKCLTCNASLSFSQRKNKFCCHSCAATYTNSKGNFKIHKKDYIKTPNKCETCNKMLPYHYRSRRYCCKKCSPRVSLEPGKCIICSSQILPSNGVVQKTCSAQCYSVLARNNAINRQFGGETNYKKYKYNGIWMDSRWEVMIAKFLDNHQVSWMRDRTKVFFNYIDDNNVKRFYYPDFYLPKFDLYLDPKNSYKQMLDETKLQKVLEQNRLNLMVSEVDEMLDDLEQLLLAYKSV